MRNLYRHYSKFFTFACVLILAACATTNSVREGDSGVKAATEATVDVKDSFAKAVQYMETDEYQQAIDLLEKINEQNNRLPGVHANLGVAYGKINEYEKAQTALEEAVKLNSESPLIMNEMAIAYRNSGDFAASKKAYEQILEKNPKSVQSHLNLGILCDIYMNDIDCALKHYKEYEAIYAAAAASSEVAKKAEGEKTVKKEKKVAVFIPKIEKNEQVVHWITDLEKRK